MEQSCDDSTVTVTDEDIDVANIILELPRLIFQSQSPHRFPFTSWFSKKKRSSRVKVMAAAPLPSPLPPSLVSNAVTVGLMEKPLTSSPATPLAFSPSESDEKLKPQGPSKRKPYINNLNKKKEQLVEITEDFTRRNELLKKDVETKKRYHDQLKAENLELKAKKQKLYDNLSKSKTKDPNLETSKSLNLEIELTTQITMKDETVQRSATSEYPIGGMICWLAGGMSKLKQRDNVGPVGLFDLNVSAEEALFDMETATKARAAQARFNRKQICRSKNYNATYKSCFPI